VPRPPKPERMPRLAQAPDAEAPSPSGTHPRKAAAERPGEQALAGQSSPRARAERMPPQREPREAVAAALEPRKAAAAQAEPEQERPEASSAAAERE
jgi:hypothetical protein